MAASWGDKSHSCEEREKALRFRFYCDGTHASPIPDGGWWECVECKRAYARRRMRRLRALDKEGVNAYKRECYAKWRGEEIARHKLWREDNRLLYKCIKAAFRGKKRAALHDAICDGSVTGASLMHLWNSQGGMCAGCNAALPEDGKTHLDHIVSLHDGGGHTITNVQWMCSACNLRKHANESAAKRGKKSPFKADISMRVATRKRRRRR